MAAQLDIVINLQDKASRGLKALKGKLGGVGKAAGTVLRAGVLAGGVALAGLGVAAFKFGNDFLEAQNIIKVGTGATGEALEGLNEDFKATFAEVPADMKTVAQATADLNTRLGLTGEPLQDMTRRFLELSRITDTDVTTNIQAVTRLFGDWAVATEDQAGSLDRLFNTSQATGIGVDKLSQLVVQFGAPLRGFGFSLDQSTALLAKFEKEGVNTEAVMGGLKIGLGKLAAAGKDPQVEFAKVSEAIQNAGSIGEANAAAIGLFGTRAGPDMAAAIREGRFEIDDFIAQMDAGGTGILETAEATETWQEKLKKLRNKVLVKLEPTLVGLVEKVGELADWLGEKLPGAIDKVEGFIKDVRPEVEKFARTFKEGLTVVRDAFEPLVRFILNNKPVLIAAIAAIGIAILLAFGPGAIAIAAIIGLIVLIGVIKDNWESLKDFIVPVGIALGIVAGIIFALAIPALIGMAAAGIAAVAPWLLLALPIIAIVAAIALVVAAILFLIEHFDQVKAALGTAAEFIGDKAGEAKDFLVNAFNTVLDFLKANWPLILAILTGPLGLAVLAVIKFKDDIAGFFQSLKDAVAGKVTGLKDGVLDAFRTIRDTVPQMISAMATGIKGGINAMIGFFERGINNIIRAWNSLEFKLPKVDLGPLGSIGGGTIGTPNIPLVNLPRLVKGGEVLRTGVAVVHEGEEFTRKGGRAQVFERGAFEGAQFIVSDPEDLFSQLRRLGTA